MDISTSEEFIKVYGQISRLLDDVAAIAKDCYEMSVISYDEIDNTPQNLSDFNNDQGFITEEVVDKKIQEIPEKDDSNYLKKTGEDLLICDISTKFKDLRAETQDDDDSSDNVATTEFVHKLVKLGSDNAVSCVIGRYNTKDFVTKSELDAAVEKAIDEHEEGDISELIDEKVSEAIQDIEIPSKTSELLNDSGFITINDVPLDSVTSVNGLTGDVNISIPTVPTNISAFNNDAGYITDPGVTSVNNRSGAVSIQENVLSDWNATTGLAAIKNKPALKRVATTADYNDLENTPDIPTKITDLTNDSDFATVSDVQDAVAALVDSAPETLDTLQELADALGNDANFVTTITDQVNSKYTKPTAGIPKSDLSGEVLTSLQNADWALNGVLFRNDPTGAVDTKKVIFNSNLFEKWDAGNNSVALKGISSIDNSSTIDDVWGSSYADKSIPTTGAVKSKLDLKYTKPQTGIPKSDLSTDVQTALDREIPTLYAGSATTGGAAYKTGAIPFGHVDSTSTATVFTATVDGITELTDGTCVMLKNGVITSASGFTININNLGAHPCFNNMTAATRDTTIFNKDYTMLMVYDSTRVVDGITGAWCCYRGYDANTNTIGYQLRTNSSILKTSDTCRYYKIFFTSADGSHWVPASVNSTNNATAARPVNQRPINPFGPIVYTSANTNYTAESNVAATTIWQQYNLTLGYSFNRTGAALTLTTNTPVYIKCAPQADGSAIIDADEPYVQALPNTLDGKIYIFLGIATSATAVELCMEHPVYYYKAGAIRLWTGLDSIIATLEARIAALEELLATKYIATGDNWDSNNS